MIAAAKHFCEDLSKENHESLLGVTDGKRIGTYIEHRFQDYLSERYVVTIGSSARGIDLPDKEIMTDIKVTSIAQPQSSCPFEDGRQKVFGLGYNLLVFVYEKRDKSKKCRVHFTHCTFIAQSRTGDYTTTRLLRQMLDNDANREDIAGFLQDRNIPGDEITHFRLADEILQHKPKQGYLTISNALQWRLQYARAIGLDNEVSGIENYKW